MCFLFLVGQACVQRFRLGDVGAAGERGYEEASSGDDGADKLGGYASVYRQQRQQPFAERDRLRRRITNFLAYRGHSYRTIQLVVDLVEARGQRGAL